MILMMLRYTIDMINLSKCNPVRERLGFYKYSNLKTNIRPGSWQIIVLMFHSFMPETPTRVIYRKIAIESRARAEDDRFVEFYVSRW